MPTDASDRDASARDERGLVDLVHRLSDETQGLVRAELHLARAEAGAYAGRWASAAALLWIGSLLITALVVMLALSAAMALAPVLGSMPLAAAAVASTLLVLALAMALVARRLMRPSRAPSSIVFRWLAIGGGHDRRRH